MSEREPFVPRFGKGPAINWTKLRDENAQLREALRPEHVEGVVVEALDALEASGWVVPLHVRECLPGDIARALGDTPDE
jgi:hypothetical protein